MQTFSGSGHDCTSIAAHSGQRDLIMSTIAGVAAPADTSKAATLRRTHAMGQGIEAGVVAMFCNSSL